MKKMKRFLSLLMAFVMMFPAVSLDTFAASNEKFTSGLSVEVSGTSEGDAANIFDGDRTTFWTSQVSNSTVSSKDTWLIVDLGDTYTINQVDYTPRWYDATANYWKCTGNIKKIVVEVSTDKSAWKEVTPEGGLDISDKIVNENTVEANAYFPHAITFNREMARYVRISAGESYHHENANVNKYITVGDLDVYKAVPENLALNKTVVARWTADEASAVPEGEAFTGATDDHAMSYAVDGTSNDAGNFGEFGASGTDASSYMQIDLGEVYEIETINMWRHWSDGRTYGDTLIAVAESEEDFKEGKATIIFNADEGNRHGLGAGTDADYSESASGMPFSAPAETTGRYVRVYMTGSTGDNKSNHVCEVQVMGYEVEETEEEEPEEVTLKIAVADKPADGKTTKQPFPSGTADSTLFRIPAIITLSDGTLVAAADARWGDAADAFGIDTIVSRSSDNGENWDYTFANHLGDYGNNTDNPSVNKKYAATFIDPALLCTEDDTIYMLADLFAGGYATNRAPHYPLAEKGFTDDGYLRIKASGADTYDYYLKEGQIIGSDGNAVAGYTVDGKFNLYFHDVFVGNLFFNSDVAENCPPYQVYPTTYLYLTKSVNHGASWSDPQLLNLKNASEAFYGVCPGRGLVTEDGTMIFCCYSGNNGEKASLIYSANGTDWSRTANVTVSCKASESQLVELENGTFRMFFRNDQSQVCYIDVTENSSGDFEWSADGIQKTGLYSCSNTMMSAIKYSEKIDGKEAIIISYPASDSATGNTGFNRTNGRIVVGLVQADGTMDWKYTYEVNNSDFWYSCLTELADGSIGILYEYGSTGTQLQYTNYAVSATAADDLQLTEKADVKIWASATDSTEVLERVYVAADGAAQVKLNNVSTDAEVNVTPADESVVTAEYDAATGMITLTGVSEGTLGYAQTTVTVTSSDGGVAVFDVTVADVEEEKYEYVTMIQGDSVTFTDSTGDYTNADLQELNTGVADASIATETEIYNGRIGTDSNYTGDYINLEDCLYTFTAVDGSENTYTISNTTKEGTTVYLHWKEAGTAGCVNSTSSANITFSNPDASDTSKFQLMDGGSGTGGACLYFHYDGNYRFNRQGSYDANYCDFNLYKKNDEVTAGIAGYEKVASLNDITSGEQYLIVPAANPGYAVYPSTNASNVYTHVAHILRGAQLGTNNTYSGNYIPLEDCLYTFTKNETTGTYEVAGVDADGNTVYFNPGATSSNSRWPHSTTSANVTVEKGNAGNAFYLSAPSGSNQRYAYFSDGNKYFDAGNDVNEMNNSDSGYHFFLFKKKADVSNADVFSGYEMVTDVDAIGTGEKYLILAQHDTTGQYYAAYPNTATTDSNGSSNAYLQVAKIDGGTKLTGVSEITFTGVAEGNTAVTIGNTRYYIKVTGVEDKNVTLKAGETLRLFTSGGTLDGAELAKADHTVAVVTGETKTLEDYAAYLYDGSEYTNANTIPLSDCIYLFEKNADGTYTVSATAADGTRVYLNPRTDVVGYPNSMTAEKITVEPADGGFKLVDTTDTKADGTNYSLVFKNDWKVFNEEQSSGVTTAFKLYELKSNASGDYTYGEAASVHDGGQYVIAAEFTDTDGNTVKYVLHPSTATQSANGDVGRNAQVAKWSGESVEITGHEILIRGIAEGNTSALAGLTRYHITVEPADDRYVSLKAGESVTVSGGITTAPVDTNIATAEETSTTTYTKVESLDDLEDAGEYLIVPVLKTTHAVSKNESNKSPSGMALEAMGDDLSALYWRVLVNGDGTYSVQDPVTGQYMVINGNDVSLGLYQKLDIVPLTNNGHSGFGIKTGSTYLNCYGGVGNNNAAAYNGSDGASTWYIYKRETTFTGVTQGETTAVVNGITYHIEMTGLGERDVVMYLGDKGTYTGNVVENTDTNIVSTVESTTYPYSKASEIVSGSQYLITSKNQQAIVKNDAANGASDGSWSGTSGLRMQTASFADTDYSDHLWTFTAVNDGTDGQYYVQNKDGAYLKIAGNNSVTLVTDEQPVIKVGGNSTDGYTLSNADSTYHLNNFGGENTNKYASGYGGASTWYLYSETPNPVTTVTAETVGTSDVTIGNTIYHITVKEAEASYLDTVYLTVGKTVSRTNQGLYDATIALDESSYDTAVVSAALTDHGNSHTVSFTGSTEGRTVVDVGPTRYYVYVGKAVTDSVVLEEDIVIYVGQTKHLVSTENGVSPTIWEEGYDAYLENIFVEGVNQDLLAVRGSGDGNTINYGGISKYYVGEVVDLSDCLYTFTAVADAENTYTISADGVSLGYTSNDKKPNKTSASNIQLIGYDDGQFNLKDVTNTRFLYFWRSGNNINTYDGGDGSADASAAGYKFALYRPATADELEAGTDTTLPGYVQVTSVDDVQDGGQYLMVASYDVTVDGKAITYHYAIYPSTGSGAYDQSVQIITAPETGNKFSEVTFTGKAEGKTTLTVGTKTYHITVKEIPEDLPAAASPIVAGSGNNGATLEYAGQPVSKLVISADRDFDLNIGNGYSDENVTWRVVTADENWDIVVNGDGTYTDVDWADITTDGTVSIAADADTTKTYRGYVVATVNGVDYKIPLQISPMPTNTSIKEFNYYLKTLNNVDTYYGWIYGIPTTTTDEGGNTTTTVNYVPTTLMQAVEGQVLDVSISATMYVAIDFFSAAHDGYVLTQMRSSQGLNHYANLIGDTPAETEFLTTTGYAGTIQYNTNNASAENLVDQAMKLNCDGALGFTRPATDPNSSSAVLTFSAEQLPTVEKTVMGVMGANGLQETYRSYTKGMAVTEGEYVYFKVSVTTYDGEIGINYTKAELVDTLQGAAFYAKDGTETPTNDNGESKEDILTDIQADGTVGNVHEYYVVYQITAADIEDAKTSGVDGITNTVELSMIYSSRYKEATTYESTTKSEAKILLADSKLKDIVVDFGLPVQKKYSFGVDSYYKDTYNEQTNQHEPLGTMYGEVTVENEEITTDGNVTGYETTVTYTPTQMLQGADSVTLTKVTMTTQEVDGVEKEVPVETAEIFYVYPGTSVYYEEGFADYTGDWGENISKGTECQTLRNIEEKITEEITAVDPYGYDEKYALENAGPSNGTEAVSSAAGDLAQFTFTGSGVDVYANCETTPTGTISVLVRNADNNIEKLVITSTKVAGTEGTVTAGQNALTNAYHLPVVSIGNLTHGKHNVTIGHSKTKEEADKDTIYPVKLDGFRVYYTLKDHSIYLQHKESYPTFLEMRNAVLGAVDLKEVLDNSGAENAKSLYVEDIAAGLTQVYNSSEAADPVYGDARACIVKADTEVYASSAKELLDNGPKNEIFLYPGESLIFGLFGGLENVQIGLKAVNGTVDALSVTKQTVSKPTAGDVTTNTEVLSGTGETAAIPATISSSTDMFYRLGDTEASTDDTTKTTTITITNNSTNGSVLSITDLKYFNAVETNTLPLSNLSANDFVPLLLSLGYEENPDANEPEDASVTEVFSDVAEEAWYVDAVQYVYDAGIMTGNGELFRPNEYMTRAQIVSTLYRLAGSPEVTDDSACDKFTDVEAGAWYADAVCWAYNTGITTGNSATTFGVNVSLTREQLATFLYRYANNEGLDTTAVGDLSTMLNADQVKAYSMDAVVWAVGAGIISGSEVTNADGSISYDLAPQAAATRAQLASILMGFCEAYDL